ncbi:MAG: hypothetical protein D0531_07335 [Methylococcales bacterium]|nr:MAG: hypothetical protein D0531_07335 [Methylococcales bacterium]
MSILSGALKRLLASDQLLTASTFTASQRKELEQFALSTRQIEVLKKGRSIVYQIINRQSLINYLRQMHPLDNDLLASNLPVRSRNIGTERNSKAGRSSHDCCYLLMKAWDSEVIWENEKSTMRVAELTEDFGAATLQVSLGQRWRTNSPLLLVENQALFDRCDWLPENFNGCLVYYAGQLSELLLQWLAEQKRSDAVTLFPDYDGVGLSNFLRLKSALHPDSHLYFYWLPDWENKLITFGSTKIWQETRVLFENALQKLEAMNALNDDFIKLGYLTQHHGKTLEQEAIWL